VPGEGLTYRKRIFRVKIAYRCKKFSGFSFAGDTGCQRFSTA
jgi:hypothetical protein